MKFNASFQFINLISNRSVLIIIAIIIVSTLPKVRAQQKVLGEPLEFDYISSTDQRVLYNPTLRKSKTKPWIVISDRSDNPVYESSTETSTVVQKLKFKEMYYVVDETDTWIKIASANAVNKLRSSSIEPVGWIRKDKMLLWNSGLTYNGRRVFNQILLKNTLDGSKSFYDPDLRKEGVKINASSYGLDLYVLKREDGAYLLSSSESISIYNIDIDLKGWLSEEYVLELESKLFIEPNFEEAAFTERQKDERLLFQLFSSPKKLMNYVRNSSVLGFDDWTFDPAARERQKVQVASDSLSIFSKDFLQGRSSSNLRRWNGSCSHTWN